MKIQVIKERRKTIVLKIVDCQLVVVKVPKALSDKKIQEFIESKRNWMEKTVLKMEANNSFSKNYDLTKFVYVNGEKVGAIRDIIVGFELASKETRKKLLTKYYKSMFSNLIERAKEISVLTGLRFKDVKMCNSVRVWGSYSSVGVMKLNWKLVILPKELIDYVICHELCHSLHMNHSPLFWKSVEKLCPDFKKRKKILNQFAFVLKQEF